MSRFDVKYFCTPPDPELLCGICMNVLDEPKETPCRHVFCRVCITIALGTKEKCPMCRTKCEEEDLQPVLPLVQNLLNKLPMRCINYRDGEPGTSCNETIKKEFYFSHMQKCEYSLVACTHRSCKAIILRKDRHAHQKVCEHRKVTCTKGCNTRYKWKDHSTHNCLKAMKRVVRELEREKKALQKKVAEMAAKLKLKGYDYTPSPEVSSSRQYGKLMCARYSPRPNRNLTGGRPFGSGADPTPTQGSSQQDNNFLDRGLSPGSQTRQDRMRRSAWGMFGFGSDTRPVAAEGAATRNSSQGQSSSYDFDSYGPPVVDMTEEDLVANYSLDESDGEEDSNGSTEQQTQRGEGRQMNLPPIINLMPPAFDYENEGYEVLHQEEGYSYEEEYDSYGEDVWEPHQSWSVSDVDDEGFSRDENHNHDHNDNYELTSAEQDDPNSFDPSNDLGTTPVGSPHINEDNFSNGSTEDNVEEEYVSNASDSNTASDHDLRHGQRRPREFGAEQDEEGSRRKRPRTDTNHGDRQMAGEASTSTVSSTSEAGPGQGWSLPGDRENPDSDRARRRSGRLQGLTPPPSSIPNVAVPLSTAELLYRYTSDTDSEEDDDSYEPSMDSEED